MDSAPIYLYSSRSVREISYTHIYILKYSVDAEATVNMDVVVLLVVKM